MTRPDDSLVVSLRTFLVMLWCLHWLFFEIWTKRKIISSFSIFWSALLHETKVYFANITPVNVLTFGWGHLYCCSTSYVSYSMNKIWERLNLTCIFVILFAFALWSGHLIIKFLFGRLEAEAPLTQLGYDTHWFVVHMCHATSLIQGGRTKIWTFTPFIFYSSQ